MSIPRALFILVLGAAVIAGASACGGGSDSPRPPKNLDPPTLAGDGIVGHPLTANRGSWARAVPSGFGYRWTRCDTSTYQCRPIEGARSRVYVPSPADLGRAIRVVVAATNAAGTTRATSQLWNSVTEPGRPPTAFVDRFDGNGGLITNEQAYWKPADPLAVRSFSWQVTSGSLFYRDGAAWTGKPDRERPGPRSATATNSAVFRLVTRRRDFGDVSVSFRLRNDRLVGPRRGAARSWDGVHVFLRYRSETNLYAATVNRRDATVVIKKKCPGGSQNGGTYYDVAPPGSHAIPFGRWQRVSATVANDADGAVALLLSIDGVVVASGTDHGVGCPAITAPGGVGIRGDDDEFDFDDFRVAGAARVVVAAGRAAKASASR